MHYASQVGELRKAGYAENSPELIDALESLKAYESVCLKADGILTNTSIYL